MICPPEPRTIDWERCACEMGCAVSKWRMQIHLWLAKANWINIRRSRGESKLLGTKLALAQGIKWLHDTLIINLREFMSISCRDRAANVTNRCGFRNCIVIYLPSVWNSLFTMIFLSLTLDLLSYLHPYWSSYSSGLNLTFQSFASDSGYPWIDSSVTCKNTCQFSQ